MSDSGLLALDAAARERALDPQASFIVRAPAGSGKTELLIQRVLALLATVDEPEQVVAITFTRKAASEMRQRLLEALASAQDSKPPQAEHEQRTFMLARAVRQRDAAGGWNLLANPNRLRVQTIDALAQWLARQLPLTLGLGAAPAVTEHAEELYAAAARATLAVVDSRAPADQSAARHVARLLAHLDNDVERAVTLLSAMLVRRDQWLRHLGGRAREELEGALQRACERQMQRVCGLLPAQLADELLTLARYAAANGPPDGPLTPCADLAELPEPALERLGTWCALASLLLTRDGQWRARFTRAEGFPPGADVHDRRRAQSYRQRIQTLISELHGHPELRAELHALRALPPGHYADAQWEIVQTIVAVLPHAAAQLAVTFAESGAMDFTEVTRRAAQVLADRQASDIALALDSRIRHLLIDEFQDTSITQFELVERLVADWTTADGRTLFIVGDPMQSIYRFREADVGLFLRASEQGIAALPLEPLRLTRNFRSHQGLVAWVNEAFARVLPARNDVAAGAVSFEPALAVHAATFDPAVMVHPLVGGDVADEAACVVDLVRQIRSRQPQASVALLVRARTHLVGIAAALRQAGLRPTAVELDVLAARPLIGDLLALTRALDHAADRIAWLAVLRAPWCGLTLADLVALAEGVADRTIGELLADPDRLDRLSPDGRQRVERVGAVLRRGAALRERMPNAERVEQTWLLLGGPACLVSDSERLEAELFFQHLAQHEDERGGRVDVAALARSLEALYAAPSVDADPAFHVMTIHKAKGLEFDHVIVPGLSAPPRRDDPQLLVWLERATEHGTELLLAPIQSGGHEKDSLVRWVETELIERQRREDERLAYVAATRARQRLHWIARVERDTGGQFAVPSDSLLARLWPVLKAHFEQAEAIARDAPSARVRALLDQSLQRLPAGWTAPGLPAAVEWITSGAPHDVAPAIEFSWAGETARRIGTVVHRWLQRMAEDGLVGWDAARVSTIAPQVERALAASGLTGAELHSSRARVLQALTNVVDDPRGRWLLGTHREQRSELRLTAVDGGRMRRLVLDRTFVTADGTRWIVDYKVGLHEGGDVAMFLDSEQLRYRSQLETYGAALDPAAQLGLYFPLVPGWRAWKRGSDPDDHA